MLWCDVLLYAMIRCAFGHYLYVLSDDLLSSSVPVCSEHGVLMSNILLTIENILFDRRTNRSCSVIANFLLCVIAEFIIFFLSLAFFSCGLFGQDHGPQPFETFTRLVDPHIVLLGAHRHLSC